ncbi:AcrR family transcriptional regulator [Roseovarius sp. MBR-78]|uniref:TetR/AcrR family transcriptional regulator n=1 Tax=Roseovarius sp. MBR-78 TaxID=3156460 RepID=UPI003398849C
MPRPIPNRGRGAKARGIEESNEPVESVVEILDCAAQCFMEMGFQGTSIDDVARRLGATKGRIYYYYSSKANLFFDVHREGMDRLMKAVKAAMKSNHCGTGKLLAMVEAHALTMMQNIAYESVVVQGVQMHRLGATTPEQRRILDELMAVRKQFEELFVDVLRQGQEDGNLAIRDLSLCAKGILGAVNWMAVWYRPRADDSAEVQKKMAREIAYQQVYGLLRDVSDQVEAYPECRR